MIPTLGADHHSGRVWRVEAVPMTAHPSDLAARVPENQREVGNILGNHGTCPNKCVPSNCDSADDSRVSSDAATTLESCGLIQRMPVNLGSGITHICEHTGWSQEHVIFDDNSSIDGHIILNLDVASHCRATINIHVLPDDATLANSSTLHDVRKVPNLRASSNLGSFVDIGGLVHKVRSLWLCFCGVFHDTRISSKKRALAGI